MMREHKMFSLILYVLGFLLLWEWLLPLEQVTKTSEVQYFIIFVVASLLLNFFHFSWYITWPLKAAFIFYALYAIFSESMEFILWLSQLLGEIKVNTSMVLSRDWLDLSPLYRSLLFFLLLWQITYLLRYWLMIKRKIFVFYFMTIFYIALLDTFTQYNGDYAIVRIVIIGFILLGLLFFKRVLESEKMNGQHLLLRRWVIPLASMIGFGVVIGYLSPKAAPIWPDPVPFIESKAENMGRSGISRIGYGVDDSQLGGPFLSDDRLIFTVATPTRQYWKIETKDTYTGKGWIASNQTANEAEEIPYGEERLLDDIGSNSNKIQEAMFNFEVSYSHVVRPYGFLSIEGETSGFLRYDPRLDKLTSYSSDLNEVRLPSYTIKYKPPSYSMQELKRTKGILGGADFSKLQEQYTQLPEELPERVHRLALELTGEYDNWYDKALAIENHFQTGEFSYDQTRVAVPKDGQDYVDQFLFDTKRGYCDNFSTSMVVMLRSLDIPARWVKGYAPGQYKGASGDGNRIYEITNNEAHSWVEMFFPSLGWVPFEPTKGFNNPTNIVQDEQTGSTSEAGLEEKSSETEDKQLVEKEAEEKENPDKANEKDAKAGNFYYQQWAIVGFAVILIVLLACVFIFSRNYWIPRFWIRTYRIKKEEEDFTRAYGILLKRLGSVGLKRPPGQTLRSYADDVDRHFNTTDMSQLTKRYEELTYSRNEDSSHWDYSKELWENLMKKTMNRMKKE